MENKVVISNSKKRIEINDSGEYIVFDTRSPVFLLGFLELAGRFESKSKDYEEGAKKVSAMPGNTTAELVEKAIAANELNKAICDDLAAQVNELFEDDVCKKLFGDASPNVFGFVEFFAQLVPIVNAAQKEQNERIGKYTAKYRKKE